MKAIAKENYDLFQKREQEIKIANSKAGETEEADNSAYNVEATVSYLEKVMLKYFFDILLFVNNKIIIIEKY